MTTEPNNLSAQQEPASFEPALARLEEIAQQLDRGEVPLADALNLCAEAAALQKLCRTKLAEAEGKLQQLLEMANGEIRLEPMEK